MDRNDSPVVGDSEQFKINQEIERRLRALEGSAQVRLPAGRRNVVRNGNFAIWQRGFGAVTTPAYFADGWVADGTISTFSADGAGFIAGGEATSSGGLLGGGTGNLIYARDTWVGNAGAGSYHIISQHIEDVRTLQGKTVTVSFWARCTTPGKFLGVELGQAFGSGGSPSAFTAVPGQKVTMDVNWTRHSLTFVLPSTAGKTLGTAGNDHLQLNFWLAGDPAAYTVRSGGVGIQSGTMGLHGVQLEEGPIATPFEDLGTDAMLRWCQRYFQRYFDPPLVGAVTGGGNSGRMTMVLPVTMRGIPTVTVGGTTNLYDGVTTAVASAVAATYHTTQSIEFDFTNVANGMVAGRVCLLYNNSNASTWNVSAEL